MVNIKKIVNTRYNALVNGNYDLKTIYEIMYSKPEYLFAEENNGYKIFKYTYGEVDNKTKDYAYSFMQKYPNIKDEYIGIALESSINWIYAFWMIILSGNKPYLVNLRHPKSLSNEIIKDLGCKYIIGLEDLGYDATLIKLDSLDLTHPSDFVFPFSNEICLSTSATTMHRKVIFFTGKEITYQILNVKDILKQNKQIKKHYKGYLKQLVFLPLYHIFGLMATYLWFTFFGRTLVFLNNYNSQTILQTIKKHNVTHIFAVPLFWHTIYKEVMHEVNKMDEKTIKKFNKGLNTCIKLQKTFPNKGQGMSKHFLRRVTSSLFGKSVRFTISGGSYLHDSTLKLINGLGYPLYNGYGMSEIGITSVELGNINDRLKNSIGKPFNSVEYKIIDNVLYCKGDSISHKIMVDGVIEEVTDYYKTNDIVYKDNDNRYYIEGRLDDLFIGSNGENINPDMIEKELNISAEKYSVLDIDNKLSLVIELKEFMTSKQIEALNDEIIKKNNSLDLSMQINKIYYTYDMISNPNAIKVSRSYLKKLLENNSVNLKTYEELNVNTNKNVECDETILNKVKELIGEVLEKNIDEINNNSNFFFDLDGTSLDYFNLISKLSITFNCEINLDNKTSNYTPLSIALMIEEILS